MIYSLLRRAFPLIALLAISHPVNADWINLTGSETAANIAEIYVMDDHVRLVLEVYVGDLEVFEDLVPDVSGGLPRNVFSLLPGRVRSCRPKLYWLSRVSALTGVQPLPA
jgi:hypothetical protein